VPDGYLDDGLARAWAREGFAQALADPKVRLLVADLNGSVVGMAQPGWSDEGIAALWRLYLRQDQRGQGLGRRMWQAIIADLPAHLRTLRTSVVRGNPALRFYQRLGFGIIHEGSPEYAGYGVPLLLGLTQLGACAPF
jgi:ribosomal protein S18 acetylase RimI-like enzyme